MHHHQSDSDSSDDSMGEPPSMKSESPRRRRSSNEPTDRLSDIAHLREELKRLHEDISPECNEHIKKMTDLVDGFEKDYRLDFKSSALAAGGAVIGGLVLGAVLSAFTAGASLVTSGLGAVAAGGAAGGVAAALVIREFRKKQQEKNLIRTIEIEIEQIQNKVSPIINTLEKIFNHTQEIMKDPTLSKHKANAIREYFTCFEQIRLFQTVSSREVGAQKHLTGDLSECFAGMSSVLKILEEIIEDKEEQYDNDDPEETPTDEQIDEKEFKEKAEKFIDEMRKGIDNLKNVMNEIDLTKRRLLKKEYNLMK